MAEEVNAKKEVMTEPERKKANDFVIQFLQDMMYDGKTELTKLRRKLSITYFVIVVLSIIMFLVGIILLSVPAYSAFTGNISALETLISAGFGIADLAALFLFKPMERIHQMMGDMSQIVLALNSYQVQVGLRLIQLDINDRLSVGKAAEDVSENAKKSIKLIQDYFEAREQSKSGTQTTIKATDQ